MVDQLSKGVKGYGIYFSLLSSPREAAINIDKH